MQLLAVSGSHLLGMLCSWRTSFIPQLLLLAANIFPSQGFASVKGNVMAVAEQKAAAEKQGALAVLSEHLYAFPTASSATAPHSVRTLSRRCLASTYRSGESQHKQHACF